ncbi:type I-E CRISPR-associated protein Cas6/Cse3/CasE [soil metagenome]
MILTSIYINAVNREVRDCLADTHAMHVRIMSLFGRATDGPARASFGVLYRCEVDEREGTVRLLLQSRTAPDFAKWPAGIVDPRAASPNPRTTQLEPLLGSLRGQYRFRLRANATRKIDTKTREDGTKSNGQRVPLRSDEDRIAWLTRQAEHHGFRLATTDDGNVIARVLPGGSTLGRRGKANVTHEGALFEGVLVVGDAALLREAVVQGVGPGKSYGFGLLSLAPFR